MADQVTLEERHFLERLPIQDCVTHTTTQRELVMVASLRSRGLITVKLAWETASKYSCSRTVLATQAGANALAAAWPSDP